MIFSTRSGIYQVMAAGNAFSNALRAAIGPEELERLAVQSYLDGVIEVDELEKRLDRVWKERG